MPSPSLHRCASEMSFVSISSSSTTSTANTAIDKVVSRNSRRRVSHSQRQALQKLYDKSAHPSREERVLLAMENGMDLKAVTIWFQNKRQTSKRRSHITAVHRGPNSSFSPSKLERSVSLDHFAQLSERLPDPKAKTCAYPRPPLTPRSTNRTLVSSQSDIWTHMPSSPIAPFSSPNTDKARFTLLPPSSRTMRSLEWACAQARIDPHRDRENTPIGFPHSGTERDTDRDDDSTDTETDEAITPSVSVDYPLPMSVPLAQKHAATMDYIRDEKTASMNGYKFQDVDAALVLLDFMGQR